MCVPSLVLSFPRNQLTRYCVCFFNVNNFHYGLYGNKDSEVFCNSNTKLFVSINFSSPSEIRITLFVKDFFYKSNVRSF